MIIQLLWPAKYDLSSVAAGQSILLPLANNIDASGAREVIVAARIHSAGFDGQGTAPTLAFVLVDAAPWPDGAAGRSFAAGVTL